MERKAFPSQTIEGNLWTNEIKNGWMDGWIMRLAFEVTPALSPSHPLFQNFEIFYYIY